MECAPSPFNNDNSPTSREMIIDNMLEIQANIDDMTPEQLSFLCTRLFSAGAMDVWQEPIVMKKGRLAQKVCALTHPDKKESVLLCFFKNSTSAGIRIHEVTRYSLPRSFSEQILTDGTIRCKTTYLEGSPHHTKAEFDDCAQAAENSSRPIMQLQQEALKRTK